MKSSLRDGRILVQIKARPAVSHHPAALVKGCEPMTSETHSYSVSFTCAEPPSVARADGDRDA